MNRLAENCGAADAGYLACQAQRARYLGGGDFDADGSLRLQVRQFAQGVGSAVGDQLSVIDVGDMAAAFGFVHVMCSYKESDAVAGELEQQVPELAPRDRVNPGGGFVEEKQLGFVQH